MTHWEIGVVAGVVTAAILALIRWRFKGRASAVTSVAFVVVMLLTGSVAAAPVASADGGQGQNQWSGTVARHTFDCQWIQQTIQQGNFFQPGNPRIDTYGSVDGNQGCTNHGFVARPGSLSIRQDLWWWFGQFGVGWVTCNNGPRIANDGFATHALSTGFGFNIGGPAVCGNTYYVPNSYDFYNPPNSGTWDGSVVAYAVMFVWTNP